MWWSTGRETRATRPLWQQALLEGDIDTALALEAGQMPATLRARLTAPPPAPVIDDCAALAALLGRLEALQRYSRQAIEQVENVFGEISARSAEQLRYVGDTRAFSTTAAPAPNSCATKSAWSSRPPTASSPSSSAPWST
ncbi:hypothetical protein BAY1663_04852 [Pseudomonas sp. BAY1663]|uniref:hypothetical protein n=1 Tax=Pseudomonas sp. BAY1663 TaxID=1439940 RepID=UPI00042DF00A|nr:hypothetical protein [Pseudomonas sp. BAY1663]EXF42733.1 hypothetical protein BAY1663_04852 [Pseudomonas sp. BAY1663]